jgi:hypothetical protein
MKSGSGKHPAHERKAVRDLKSSLPTAKEIVDQTVRVSYIFNQLHDVVVLPLTLYRQKGEIAETKIIESPSRVTESRVLDPENVKPARIWRLENIKRLRGLSLKLKIPTIQEENFSLARRPEFLFPKTPLAPSQWTA